MSNVVRLVAASLLLMAGLVSLFVSVLTFAVKWQKYGPADLWQHPDAFAIITVIIGAAATGGSLYLLIRQSNAG